MPSELVDKRGSGQNLIVNNLQEPTNLLVLRHDLGEILERLTKVTAAKGE